MENRPRINLTLSPLDKIVEFTGILLLICMWGLVAYAFVKLPAIIPTHFNASGQVNGHGSKTMILVLPLIATIIYAVLTGVNKYPHIFNYAVPITEDNAQQQYLIVTRLLRYLKTAILLLFSLIILFTYLAATGETGGLGTWFLPFTIALILIPVIIAISVSFKKK